MIDPDRIEPLARACLEDAPGTVIDRWRSICLTRLLAALLGNGRDLTITMIAALTRDQVIEFHAQMMRGFLDPEMHPLGHRWRERFDERFRGMAPQDAARSYLRGHNLACACGLDERCHADTLLEIANR